VTPGAVDVVVVGAGAAGLAAAIFAARAAPQATIVALDGARKIGAKILVAGGGRCNVTNATVTPADFWGGSRNVIRRVLAAFPASRAAAFFRQLGVELHEEEHGKLFPNSNRAQDVLDALLGEARRRGVRLRTERRVLAIERKGADLPTGAAAQPDVGSQADADTRIAADPRAIAGPHARGSAGFLVRTSAESFEARLVVLATGGRSLPRTGSDGAGYAFAQALGHGLRPTTPALAPLELDGDFHAPLSGVSHEVEIRVAAPPARAVRLRGALLWTHFGVSGPVALNASRHWHGALLEGRAVTVTANLLPNDDFDSAERRLLETASQQPRRAIAGFLARSLPSRVAGAALRRLGIETALPLAHLGRDARRALVHNLLAWPLPVRDSRGYRYAEATAGGVPLDEIDPATMESRRCPGLFLVGEILDVDGRIGGFNFQWAWSSGFVCGGGLARRLSHPDGAGV